ncbi:MAG TPA: ABC transporter substrate-binding protein [Acidimicrobiales bacterium]|jgi:branched-chain amino acid transport system substrate-binding protein
MRHIPRWSSALGGAVLLCATSLIGLASTGAGAASDKAPILIGYMGDLTGPAASTFADGPAAAQARVDVLNAAGGIDGRRIKLKVVDTSSSPTGAATAAQELVSDHVFGIVENSALFFGAAKYLQQQHVPVVGTGVDGPEWGTDSNMFDALGPPIDGPLAGHQWTTTGAGALYKKLGVQRVAVLANATPSAVQSAVNDAYGLTHSGLVNCYENTSIPLGSVNVTTLVLGLKNSNCQGLFTLYVDSTDVALAEAIKQAGLNMPGQIYAEGYDNNVLDSPSARAALDGDYFGAAIDFSSPNAATKAMLANLEKYDKSFTGGVPDLGAYGAWVAEDLMIEGLEHAGSNPTPASFITNLHQVTDYDGGGLFASSFGFAHFGTAAMVPKRTCAWYVELKSSKFVAVNGGKPLCGTYEEIPSS